MSAISQADCMCRTAGNTASLWTHEHLQTFKKRCLPDRLRQAATRVWSNMPGTTGCCWPRGISTQQRFGSMLRMIAARPLPNETNLERGRIERSEVIQGAKDSAAAPVWKQETDQPRERNGQNEPGCRPSPAIAI